MAARGLVGLLLVSVFLSGCAGGGAQDVPSSSAEITAGPAEVDDETGGIQGLVTDDELQALDGVQVGITDVPGIEAITDAEGRFSLSKVPPGTHTIVAQKIGYDATAKKVDVVAGEIVDGLQFQIAPLPVDEPYPETLINRGEVKVGVGFVLSATCSNCGGQENKYSFNGKYLPKDMSALVIESNWNTIDYLGIDLVDRSVSNGIYWRVRSYHPMHYVVLACEDYAGAPFYGAKAMPCEPDEFKGNKITAETWYIGAFQQETHNADVACRVLYAAGCYGVGVAPSIIYTNYFTLFHGPAPPDVGNYTAMPDN